MAKRGKKRIRKPVQGVGFVMIEVDNPHYSERHAGAAGNPRKVQAAYNPKESPAAWYRAKLIIQEHEYQAASRFRGLYERVGGSGVKAFDYGKEFVDGGNVTDGLTDAKAMAGKELAEAHDKLGSAGYLLVEAVCGQCFWMKDIYPDQYTQRKQMKTLRECLDELAVMWGYKTRERHWRCA